MKELGYDEKEMNLLYGEKDHIGRLTVPAFLQYFKKKGMIELVKDPVLTSCIAPSHSEEYFIS